MGSLSSILAAMGKPDHLDPAVVAGEKGSTFDTLRKDGVNLEEIHYWIDAGGNYMRTIATRGDDGQIRRYDTTLQCPFTRGKSCGLNCALFRPEPGPMALLECAANSSYRNLTSIKDPSTFVEEGCDDPDCPVHGINKGVGDQEDWREKAKELLDGDQAAEGTTGVSEPPGV